MTANEVFLVLEKEGDGIAALRLEGCGEQTAKFVFACGGRTSGQLPGRAELDRSNLAELKDALQRLLDQL